ncbi:hypothetical protein [Halobacillus sp. H74]|uniref:hypothetical protein n=1 Tax=Halobacillus sp. H74 TaxID=3457436 RepID=UPI003FCE9CE6
MSRIGGQSPDAYGLSLTVKVPAATETNPVHDSYPLVYDDTEPYAAAIATDGSAFDLIAKHTVKDALTPLGVWRASGRVHKFDFSGTAPGIGTAVVANGAGGVRAEDGAAGETGVGRVQFVNAELSYVEVLLP